MSAYIGKYTGTQIDAKLDSVADILTRLGGVSIVECTQSVYSAMASHDAHTLYIVTPDPEEVNE